MIGEAVIIHITSVFLLGVKAVPWKVSRIRVNQQLLLFSNSVDIVLTFVNYHHFGFNKGLHCESFLNQLLKVHLSTPGLRAISNHYTLVS